MQLPSLARFSGLTSLDASYNKLTDVSGLASLPGSVQALYLASNKISSLEVRCCVLRT